MFISASEALKEAASPLKLMMPSQADRWLNDMKD